MLCANAKQIASGSSKGLCDDSELGKELIVDLLLNEDALAGGACRA